MRNFLEFIGEFIGDTVICEFSAKVSLSMYSSGVHLFWERILTFDRFLESFYQLKTVFFGSRL